MPRRRRRVITGRLDQLTPTKKIERSLHRAFRETSRFGDDAQTRCDGLPFRASCLAVEPDVNQIGRGLAVMADDVAHQDIEDIVVDWNCFTKSRHALPMN